MQLLFMNRTLLQFREPTLFLIKLIHQLIFGVKQDLNPKFFY